MPVTKQKLQHGRGVPDIYVPKAAPVLEFLVAAGAIFNTPSLDSLNVLSGILFDLPDGARRVYIPQCRSHNP